MKKTHILAWPLISLLLLILASLSLAEEVAPNARVNNRLNVRTEPSRDSAIVAKLEPGQTAQLLSSVPYWYQIIMDSGTVGYVSKAYARIVAAAQSNQFIRIGSWNIKKLGHGSNKDYALIADIIEVNYDLLCLVEVMQKGGGHPGYDTLINELGSAWSGIVTTSPRPRTNSGSAEFYALIYRNSLIEPCTGWSGMVYHQDNDGSPSGTGEDHFSREPAYGCFASPLNKGETGVDFLIATYHARWAGGDEDEIATEVAHIDEVFSAMARAKPNEKDIFITGDFNLVPSKLRTVVTQTVNTRGTGSTLNSAGELTTNLYDHFLVFNDADSAEITALPVIIDVRDQASTNKTFYQEVSDHLPLVVRLSTTGTDID